MRDEIIKRNTIIMTVSLLLFFIVSLIITSYTSRKSIQKQLINVSIIINNQILETNTLEELNETVDTFTDNQDWIQITIASSIGVVLKDSTDDSINDTLPSILTEEEIRRAKYNIAEDRIYLDGNKIYFISLINEDIIVKTSATYEYNTTLILMSLFYLLLLLIGVIFVSYFYTKKISKNIVDTFNELCFNLKSINEGKYNEIDTIHKYEEVQQILKEINDVNNKTYLSMLTIKNEHQKLNFVINNMQQGIIIVNKLGNILLINDYAIDALSIKKIDLDNIYYQEIITNEILLEKIKIALVNKSNYYFDIKDENKSKIYSYNITYLRNKWDDLNKDERLYVIVITDVTEERENEKLKAEFISNASHELKTPVTSIRGFSELLLVSTDLDENTKKYLTIIYNESIKLKDTIDNLLYLSNIQHHISDENNSEQLFFREVINEIIAECSETAAQKNITINVESDNSYLYVQAKLLNHLIKNLIENAIKYNKTNGFVNIKVQTEKHQIHLIIEDTGIGIEEKYLDKIFERFYRVDESHNRNTGGTGIGLNIVKQICAVLNAKITVSSKINVGTKFIVIFNKEKE